MGAPARSCEATRRPATARRPLRVRAAPVMPPQPSRRRSTGRPSPRQGRRWTCTTFGFNVRAGYEIFYPEDCGFFTSGSSLLVVRMMAALADAASVNMTFWVREMP